MDNKMTNTAKHLNLKKSLIKIKCFQDKIKEFEEDFKSDNYTIEVDEHSYIKFTKEKNYEDLLLIEQGMKCLYKKMTKTSKKGLSLLIDQLIKCFQLFSIKFILLFYDQRSTHNPFQIHYNYLYFFLFEEAVKDSFIYEVKQFNDKKLRRKARHLLVYLGEFPMAHYQKYKTQDYYQIRRDTENIKNKSDIHDVLCLIEESEKKEYGGYYEDDCQYTEKELLSFSKYDYNNAIGLISLDDEEFMNVYCNKSENVDENYVYDIDYDIGDDIDENDSNVKPTSSLFDKPKPRQKSLLIYDD